MQTTNDLRTILNAAEEAVRREDAPAAERLLRDALALQESTTDSPRDEVAKTLNNLAVVCEMTGKIRDAETCYRRAYAIAMAGLPASDPFVTTSRENLEEFCKSQGIPFERPRSAPAPSSAPPPVLAASTPEPVARPLPPPSSPSPVRAVSPAPKPPAPQPSRVFNPQPRSTPAPPKTRTWPIMVGALVVVALVVAMMAAREWFAPSAAPEPAASVPPSEPAPVAAPPTPAASSAPSSEVAREPELAAPPPQPVAATPALRAETTTALPVTVVTSELCRSLTTSGVWTCTPASGTQAPGTISFYTRVASPRDTTIEHRWYWDDRLHQRVSLRVGANASGFRTYSRTTITADRAGTWKVELRTQDGQLLDQKTFSVQ